jgi:UDP:flavonoid glycosyltransferase YjiC (YdhE family)
MTNNNKVLCSAADAYGHTIPALALGLALQARGGQLKMTSFGERMGRLFQRYGVAIEAVSSQHPDRESQLKTMLLEYEPDVTVCDWSMSLWAALTAWRPRCRVSILRCELLPGYRRRHLFLPDKFGFYRADDINRANDIIRQLGGTPLTRDQRELFDAEVIVVPSIPEIDPLPEQVVDFYPAATFLYTGPLLLSPADSIPDQLKEWLLHHHREGVPVMLVTLGTVWGAPIYTMLANCLAEIDIAVIMVIPQEEIRCILEKTCGPRFQITALTDLLELAQYADVVMHHCGHATLQTVLLAGKPSITLPSGEYDREDNALRVEALACGRHLGHEFFRDGLNAKEITSVVNEVLLDPGIAEGVAVVSNIVRQYRERGIADFVKLVDHITSRPY